MVSSIDNNNRSTATSSPKESQVNETGATTEPVEREESPTSIEPPPDLSKPAFRPSVEAVETSREALRHDPQTAHMRERLNQALEIDGAAGPTRSQTSQRYNQATEPSRSNANQTEREPREAINQAASSQTGTVDQAQPEGFHVNAEGVNVFTGTEDDDVYDVSQAADGALTIANRGSGDTFSLTALEAEQGVMIRGLGGADNITIDSSVTHDLAIFGEGGNDTIDATGALGEMLIDGGNGDDRLFGGDNMDIINGGRGNDHLYGGYGNDQVNGQDGDDRVFGQSGHDFVSGGQGADVVDGGLGSDAIYADADDTRIDAGGTGRRGSLVSDHDVDTVIAPEGSATVSRLGANDVVATYNADEAQAYLDAHPEFVVDGDQDFRDRILADIGVMLSTEQGRGLLDEVSADLVASGEAYRLHERLDGPGGSVRFSTADVDSGNFAATYSAEGAPRHPLPVLFHELAHVYQHRISGIPEGHTLLDNGRTVGNIELQATGLPWIDAQGVLHPADELNYTDNRFRAELGLPLRQGYGGAISAPDVYSPVEVGHDEHDHDHEHAA